MEVDWQSHESNWTRFSTMQTAEVQHYKSQPANVDLAESRLCSSVTHGWKRVLFCFFKHFHPQAWTSLDPEIKQIKDNSEKSESSSLMQMPLGLDFLPMGMQQWGQTKVEPGYLSPDLDTELSVL